MRSSADLLVGLAVPMLWACSGPPPQSEQAPPATRTQPAPTEGPTIDTESLPDFRGAILRTGWRRLGLRDGRRDSLPQLLVAADPAAAQRGVFGRMNDTIIYVIAPGERIRFTDGTPATVADLTPGRRVAIWARAGYDVSRPPQGTADSVRIE